MKFEILTFLPARRNFAIFWQAEFETRSQILLKLFTALHCQGMKLMCSFFAEGIYLLAKANARNLKFRPFCLLEQNFRIFQQAELETRIQILLKLSTAFHCQERKLMCPYFSEAIYVFAKTKGRNLKFGPCHLLERNFRIF